MKILITGSAGFIGYHAVKRFIKAGYQVIGIDNLNNYYDIELKYGRLNEAGIENVVHDNKKYQSKKYDKYCFIKTDIKDTTKLDQIFAEYKFDIVVHLAAQAGVRYSLVNPKSYIENNIVGYYNILESCKKHKVSKLVYASSSSIYGLSQKESLSINDIVDSPVSLYAATKKSNELMAHVYSHLYKITTVGLRFFTVYGPWGRPDMAPFIFTNAIVQNSPIKIFNHGKLQRDFTFIDDIVEGLYRISIIQLNKSYSIFNIGNNSPVKLMDFIKCVENELKKKAIYEMHDMQPGDVFSTRADTKEFIEITGFTPSTKIEEGVRSFVNWYKNYYKIE